MLRGFRPSGRRSFARRRTPQRRRRLADPESEVLVATAMAECRGCRGDQIGACRYYLSAYRGPEGTVRTFASEERIE